MCFSTPLIMNVALDYQPNCIVGLTIELPTDRVKKEWDATAKGFQKMARIPGYRPGKAPASIVESRYAKDIQEEVESKLLREAITEAAETHKIQLHSIEKVDHVEMTPDKQLRIRATISTMPIINLPDYKSVTVEVAKKIVTDEDISNFIDYLREPHSSFDPVTDRSLAMEDYAVITYEGKIGDELLSSVVPTAPAQLHGRRNAWVLMSEGTLFPGFSKAIEGMNIEESRTFTLDVPATFPITDLQGKQVTYTVTLHGINVKKLPDIDDALAEKIEPGLTLETLKEKIRQNHESNFEDKFLSEKKNAIVKNLLDSFTCDLPESVVAAEANTLLKQIVAENQSRGVSDEDLKSHTAEIFETASTTARDRVRANFLLLRIAKEENIQIAEAELYQALFEMSQRYEVPIKKLATDMSKSGGINRLREQILISKALDLVASTATVNEPAASAA